MIRMSVSVSLRYDVGASGSLALRILPAVTAQQRVSGESLVTSLGARSRIVSGRFGQRMLHVQAAPGPLEIDYSARVDLDPHVVDPSSLNEVGVADLPCDVLPFLHESPLCPIDALSRLADQTFGRMPPGHARVATLCACVRERTRLEPAQSGLYPSVLDTLIDKSGSSEHLAHLAIALCRALYIPARIVSIIWPGSAAPSGATGLHHCIEVFLGDRWYLFDPTGLAPAMGMIRIGTGRDASDIPIVSIQGDAQQTHGRLQMSALCDASGMARAGNPSGWAVSSSAPVTAREDMASAHAGRRQA